MPHSFKDLLHRRHNSVDVEPPRSPAQPGQSSEVRVLKAFAQPYEHASPGRPPVIGQGPVHGNGLGTISRPLEGEATRRQSIRENADEFHRQSLVLESLQQLDINDNASAQDGLSSDDHRRHRSQSARRERRSVDGPSTQHKSGRGRSATAPRKRHSIPRKEIPQNHSPPLNQVEALSDIPDRHSSKRFSREYNAGRVRSASRQGPVEGNTNDQSSSVDPSHVISSESRKPVGTGTTPRSQLQPIGAEQHTSIEIPTHAPSPEYAAHKAEIQKKMEGILDLRDTVDTTVTETMAPAVVHEIVDQHNRHIYEEVKFLEIHTHDIFHRILPIIDVQFLPTRHFLDGEGGTSVEIPASVIPADIRENLDRAIHEQFRPQGISQASLSTGPRRFTARSFEPEEGNHKEWEDEDGTYRQETTWIHPPVLEQGAGVMRQTQEFVFSA